MVKCPVCQTTHVHNTLYCHDCGIYLPKDKNRKTDQMNEVGWVGDDANGAKADSLSQLDSAPRAVRLKIGTRQRKVEIPLDRVIYLGRVDPVSDVFPDVDLTEHGSGNNISRRHASLQLYDGLVVVEDLGSTNGTFVNGIRLESYLPEVLGDGDNLQLGKLVIEVEIIIR